MAKKASDALRLLLTSALALLLLPSSGANLSWLALLEALVGLLGSALSNLGNDVDSFTFGSRPPCIGLFAGLGLTFFRFELVNFLSKGGKFIFELALG